MKETLLNTNETILSKKVVEKAGISDIAGVIEVQNSFFVTAEQLYENPSFSEQGFLMYKTSVEELEKVINSPLDHIFLVAKDGDKIIGYILCYSLDKWKEEKPYWEGSVVLDKDVPNQILEKKTLYLRQVAVLKGNPGLGADLEKTMLECAKDDGYEVAIGDILHSPVENTKSMKIHSRRGFKKIGFVKDGDLVWNLMYKTLG